MALALDAPAEPLHPIHEMLLEALRQAVLLEPGSPLGRRRQGVRNLAPAGPAELPEAVGAAQGVGLQFLGEAVAPAGGDLVDGGAFATGAVAADRIGGHRHGISRARTAPDRR